MAIKAIKSEHSRHRRGARLRRSKRLINFLADRNTALAATANNYVPTALASGVFTLTAHGLTVGEGPFTVTFGTTQPTGLPATQLVYIHSVPDANSFTITTRRGNVASRTQLVPSTNGSGTISMKRPFTKAAGLHRLQKVGSDVYAKVTDVDNVK